ncbi:iron ABC transporter permease [Alginatibacterium sediminis]|uniref:Iron ABC transporter permease n=1 Tax=Alginatibacterium sediminis TaxID=2164068 RepID=A0A420ECS8_9ALTE|nr:iron ABC transporter permease [Alginatibacterium sediminis]RKF18473.1 iron ABC transporter permease [Alginatibacterium sediminis]
MKNNAPREHTIANHAGPRRKSRISLSLTAALLLLVAFSLTKGSFDLSLSQLWSILNLSASDAQVQTVIWQLRMPRTLLALLIGAMLASTGAVIQGIFRNPLAEPAVIGVSSGAALGAALAIYLLSKLDIQYLYGASSLLIPCAAFVCGLLATALVYQLAQNNNGTSVMMMLLAGIAITAVSGAVISLLSYLADDQTLRQLSSWQMGSLNGASWNQVWLCAVCFAFTLPIFIWRSQHLDTLLLGEAEARYLGINVSALKTQIICLVALLVAVSVASVGIIAFVGLVVPHLVRLMFGVSHRYLIPNCALLGAVLMLAADLIARTILVPIELPVGVLTSILGAPFFILLLLKQRQSLG